MYFQKSDKLGSPSIIAFFQLGAEVLSGGSCLISLSPPLILLYLKSTSPKWLTVSIPLLEREEEKLVRDKRETSERN